MFYRSICLFTVLFFMCLAHVAASKDSNSSLIFEESVDVTGNGIEETILLEGDRLSSLSTYFPFLRATIHAQNGKSWTLHLSGGANPSVKYIDITNNGTNELLFQTSINSQDEAYFFEIYTFNHDRFSPIPIPRETFIHGKFTQNFLVHMFIYPHADPVIVDIKDQAEAYISAGIYQHDGNLTKQQDVFIKPVHAVNPLSFDGNQTVIETSQYASSMLDSKELGTIQSKWIFENDSWLLIETSWKNID